MLVTHPAPRNRVHVGPCVCEEAAKPRIVSKFRELVTRSPLERKTSRYPVLTAA